MVAAVNREVKEIGASTREMLEQLGAMHAARASMLDVTKLALADVVMLETEARTS